MVLNVGAHKIRTECRMCGRGLDSMPFFDLGHTPIANDLRPMGHQEQPVYPLFLSACTYCEAVQLPVVLEKEVLFSGDYPYTSGASATMREHLRALAGRLWGDFEPKRCLEVGSNDGTFLGYLHARGCQYVEGVDPAVDAARIAIKNGIPTTIAHFGATPLAVSEPYDLIVALNVYAHVDDMEGFTKEVRRLLTPEGTFVFEVGYFPDVVVTQNLGVIYHEHLSYHHLKPLMVLLQAHGLYVNHAERIDSQGGSIRVYASPTPRKATAALKELAKNEGGLENCSQRRGYWDSRLYDALKAVESRLWLAFDGLGPEDRIAFYGQSAKLTTLTSNVTRDQERLVACVFDDDPRKVGKFAPGRPWRIKSGSELEQINPKKVIVTAPNMIDEIKARHPLYQGEWVSL